MADLLFANNASALIAAPINTAVTAVTVSNASAFPNPGANQYFIATFVDAATGLLNEIVHVTAVSGSVFTIVRAQEGTTAKSWNVGDVCAAFWTAGCAQAMLQVGQEQAQASNYAVDTGSVNALTITLSPVPTALSALVGAPIRVKINITTTSGAVTLNVNGLGAQPVYNAGGGYGSLAIGCFVAAGIYEMIWDGTAFQYSGMINPITSALLMSPGTDNVRPVTASALNTAFTGVNSIPGTRGYQKFPNGLILQWGTKSLATGNNESVILPATFASVYTIALDIGYGGTASDTWIAQGDTASLSAFNVTTKKWNGSTWVITAGALGWVAVGL